MKAILVEDEYLAREELEYLIKTHSDIEIIGRFEDGIDALKFVQDTQVDVIFLDINIPSLDGVLLGKSISKFAQKPYIVFITAYKEHAIEAFEIEAFDYILKPYHESRITSMLQKLQNAHTRDIEINHQPIPERSGIKNKINLWKNEKIMVTDIDDIYYASAQEKVTYVYTRTDEYSLHMSISEFYNSLPQDLFFRCHRSYIINISKIREIIPWFNNTYLLKMKDLDYEVPVSRSHIKEFRQIMNI
ncbi:LytR/AlgR family response regulator transcription factor [Paenibacillus antarcticus]|uniref:DNA-binding response regulator n=1 Tax=Paenibacillus antarcticus TaxID=253703 RepID=A0A162MFC9_9BACL|nr:LytTR family DNA-binding domain-containing protein [Paenibacillus antarcticus]OAB48045.1 DNA-binding response regulator [Paenibacillus antarcticus]